MQFIRKIIKQSTPPKVPHYEGECLIWLDTSGEAKSYDNASNSKYVIRILNTNLEWEAISSNNSSNVSTEEIRDIVKAIVLEYLDEGEIITNIVNDYLKNLNIESTVNNAIEEALKDIDTIINNAISEALKDIDITINNAVDNAINDALKDIDEKINKAINDALKDIENKIDEAINNKLNEIDFNALVKKYAEEATINFLNSDEGKTIINSLIKEYLDANLEDMVGEYFKVIDTYLKNNERVIANALARHEVAINNLQQ